MRAVGGGERGEEVEIADVAGVGGAVEGLREGEAFEGEEVGYGGGEAAELGGGLEGGEGVSGGGELEEVLDVRGGEGLEGEVDEGFEAVVAGKVEDFGPVGLSVYEGFQEGGVAVGLGGEEQDAERKREWGGVGHVECRYG